MRIGGSRLPDSLVHLKQTLPGSKELLCRVQAALTPNRLKLLICIDGADGVGKSSLAAWLAWQACRSFTLICTLKRIAARCAGELPICSEPSALG